jgi:hypothetical protein
MAIKVKEIKDDAIIDIKVNKAYYLMVKATSLYIFKQMPEENREQYLKDSLTKEYKDLDEVQRAFRTITLLLSEIEQSASDQNLFDEKEVLEPGDKGYKAPSLD